MHCFLGEATFQVGKDTSQVGKDTSGCCEIDLWQPTEDTSLSSEAKAGWKNVQPWCAEMVEELSFASGMVGDKIGDDIFNNQIKALDILCKVGADSTDFINDLKIESALDLWREQDNMDDISGPSYFTQWDQSLDGTTWVTDSNPQNLDPVLLTPEMLEQNDKLNILCDEEGSHYLNNPIPDQLVTLEVLAIGDKHGVAKSPYGGVFVTKGTLTYLQRAWGVKIGDKFNCWITFTNAKYPWRTVVNGVVN